MSRTIQPKKFTFDFSHGSIHFSKREDAEDYRDTLIGQVSTLAHAMRETDDEESLNLLAELNLNLNDKLYCCMRMLAESEAENE